MRSAYCLPVCGSNAPAVLAAMPCFVCGTALPAGGDTPFDPLAFIYTPSSALEVGDVGTKAVQVMMTSGTSFESPTGYADGTWVFTTNNPLFTMNAINIPELSVGEIIWAVDGRPYASPDSDNPTRIPIQITAVQDGTGKTVVRTITYDTNSYTPEE